MRRISYCAVVLVVGCGSGLAGSGNNADQSSDSTSGGEIDAVSGDDFIYSTYSLAGTIDENGPVLEPIMITDPYE